MLVERLKDEAEWENFVAGSPGGTFYHTLKWKKILEECFSLETEYLAIRDSNGELAGVCPFTISQKARIFKILDSLPQSDFAGPLMREECYREAANSLMGYLGEMSHKRGISYARIRCSDASLSEHLETKGAVVETSSGTMNLDLEKTPIDFIWNQVFTQKSGQRTYIKRFEKDGFWNRAADGIEDLNTFYTLYHENMNYIGASPYPFSFFQKAWDWLYPDHFNVILAVNGEKTIGAEAFFIYPPRKSVYQAYIGLDRNVGTQYRTYFYLCWGLLKWAEGNGFSGISFGSTPADPTSANYSYKSKLGATFNQDYILYIPFDRKMFFLRNSAIRLGKGVKGWLPGPLKRRLIKDAPL